MKTITTYLFLAFSLFLSNSAVSQAYTTLANGDYQITSLGSEPLYMTGGTATITGISPTFTTLIVPASNTQIWTITKGTSGNATDKYFIKSKNEGVPLTTLALLKLTATGAIPATDGKFHANTLYKIGDTYAIKVAAYVADATTTYSAKFWMLNGTSLSLSAAAAAAPVAEDYIVNFIPYNGGTTSVEIEKNQEKICTVTRDGIKILNEKGDLSIFSINGKMLKAGKINGNTTFELPKGLYVVRLNTGLICYNEKVIVL